MRPNGEEVLRGVQGSLATNVLPEIESAYVLTELMLINALLGVVAGEWDGAVQRLVDDNAALRELAGRSAEALAGEADLASLAGELRSLADETDASLRVSDLSEAHGRLRDALGRLGLRLQESDAPELQELRAAVIDHLRQELEDHSLSLLGPRADG